MISNNDPYFLRSVILAIAAMLIALIVQALQEDIHECSGYTSPGSCYSHL